MDSDGQHEPASVGEAVQLLDREGLDLVAGSRFLDHSKIRGLSVDAPTVPPLPTAWPDGVFPGRMGT